MSVPSFLTLRDPKGVLVSTSVSLPAESLLERTVQPESESTVRNPAARIRYFDFIRTPFKSASQSNQRIREHRVTFAKNAKNGASIPRASPIFRGRDSSWWQQRPSVFPFRV